MCILFFSCVANPQPNGYSLVLINNRDEYFHRPTKEAQFWENDLNVIGGRDLFPGREGGTWLGMNKNGKIGVLLNILQPASEEKPDAKGRGPLVTNFLCGDNDAHSYMDLIYKEGQLYNSFNLVNIEMCFPSRFVIGHYNNLSEETPQYLQPGIYGFGNSHPSTPWKKVTYGLNKFKTAIASHTTTDSKSVLIQDLLNILNDSTRHSPDVQLEKQGRALVPEETDQLSALKVELPKRNYGTRTNTIILVDGNGRVNYIERTMIEPIDATSPQWRTQTTEFCIENRI